MSATRSVVEPISTSTSQMCFFLVQCVRVMTVKDNEGNKGEEINITKVPIYCRNYERVCKVRGCSICVFWVMSVAGMVKS